MDPWSRKNDYILATPTAVTIADVVVDHWVEEDDKNRHSQSRDRQVAMENNRCSRRSVTSDLSGSVLSDIVFDDRCRTPTVYYGRNLPAFTVCEVSVV